MILKEKLAIQIPAWRERVKKLLSESGEVKVDEVKIEQIYRGMRDIKSLVSDISYVDPNEGIRLRGYSIPELIVTLPKLPNTQIPLVGGLYYLLVTGEVPGLDEALEVEKEWQARAEVPAYVYDVLRGMPATASPMTLFTQAILALQPTSIFAQRYDEGMNRNDYWEPMFEDSMNLIAKLPTLAAFIYSLKHKDGSLPPLDADLDWSSNFAHLMGISDPSYRELSRLYFIAHSDHESGNISAHAGHLVGSALADIYFSAAAGMAGLAGPLHGRANQEVLGWLMDVYEKYQGVPSRDQLYQYAWDTLNSGQVIPGYGHAVLKIADPRFTAFREFGAQFFPEDPLYRLALLVYDVVPQVLREQGKARNPAPNVDAISGVMQYHYGVRDCNDQGVCGFYPVLFGVSRILGISANVIWGRILNQPIERPKSLTTAMLESIAEKARATASA